MAGDKVNQEGYDTFAKYYHNRGWRQRELERLCACPGISIPKTTLASNIVSHLQFTVGLGVLDIARGATGRWAVWNFLLVSRLSWTRVGLIAG